MVDTENGMRELVPKAGASAALPTAITMRPPSKSTITSVLNLFFSGYAIIFLTASRSHEGLRFLVLAYRLLMFISCLNPFADKFLANELSH
jgi:hypothetical protein